MKRVVWEVRIAALPPAVRCCGRCGALTGFECTGHFRVTPRERRFDVGLIYRCCACGAEWTARVRAAVPPRELGEELAGFLRDDRLLAAKYTLDGTFLRQNGIAARTPEYTVSGELFAPGEEVELELRPELPMPVRAASVLRRRLDLTRRELAELMSRGQIISPSGAALSTARLRGPVTVLFAPGWGREPDF